jgi:hypothetical protein
MSISRSKRLAPPRSRFLRPLGVVIVALGSTAGSFALFGSSAANAASGPDTVAGSAFGASLTGLLNVLAPTPTVTLPASGAAQSASLINLPLDPVLTSDTLIATSVANNATLATEQVLSKGEIEGLNVLGLTAGINASAVTSTCQSSATGSTGGDLIVGLELAGTPITVPTVPDSFLSAAELGPLAGVVSIELNVQTISNVIHSTSITNDAIVIKLLSVASGGETIVLAESHCAAAGPDIDVAPTVTGINPNTGPTTGGTSVTITGTGFACVSAVSFGSTPASSYTVVSPTEITATSPAGAAGIVDVTVTNCFGKSPTGAADQFTYTLATGAAGTGTPVPNAVVAPLSGTVAVTG